jgi:hypothetical protein
MKSHVRLITPIRVLDFDPTETSKEDLECAIEQVKENISHMTYFHGKISGMDVIVPKEMLQNSIIIFVNDDK